MRVVRGRPHSAVVAGLALLLLLLIIYQGAGLVAKYGSLFYVKTFLPSPPLPHQRRVGDALNPGGEGDRPLHTLGAPRVLCVVVTAPQYHQSRARHVKETWARHCDRTVFLSSESDMLLGEVVVVPQAPDYYDLWDKVIAGFEWSVEHLDEFEWLMKVDDDTFLLVENLKNLLQQHNPSDLLATGLILQDWETGLHYLNGGAGYAVSKRVVRAVTAAVQPGGLCTEVGGMDVTTAEDINMATCLKALGVSIIDSRDAYGRQRFHVSPPQSIIDPRKATDWKHLWLKKIPLHPYKFGFAEMSSEVISFHYVSAESMYLLYYLIYILNPRYLPSNSQQQQHHNGINRQSNAVTNKQNTVPTNNFITTDSNTQNIAFNGMQNNNVNVHRKQSNGLINKENGNINNKQNLLRKNILPFISEFNAEKDMSQDDAVKNRSRRNMALDDALGYDQENATRPQKLVRRNSKAVFGMTRNKKYNYFYKMIDSADAKAVIDVNNYERPVIEEIGLPDNRKRKWKINDSKDSVTDHSVL